MPEYLAPGVYIEEVSRSEEHTSELQSLTNLVCRLLLEKKNQQPVYIDHKRYVQSPIVHIQILLSVALFVTVDEHDVFPIAIGTDRRLIEAFPVIPRRPE